MKEQPTLKTEIMFHPKFLCVVSGKRSIKRLQRKFAATVTRIFYSLALYSHSRMYLTPLFPERKDLCLVLKIIMKIIMKFMMKIMIVTVLFH